MQKYLKPVVIFLIIVAVILCVMGVVANAHAQYAAQQGGLGTNQVPASGSIPIGNGAGSYTPNTLTPGTSTAISNASGSIVISAIVPATTTINGAQCPSFTFTINNTTSASSITTSTCSILFNLLQNSSSSQITVSPSGTLIFASNNISQFTNNAGYLIPSNVTCVSGCSVATTTSSTALTITASGGALSTSSAITQYNVPFWANNLGGLSGTSSISVSGSPGGSVTIATNTAINGNATTTSLSVTSLGSTTAPCLQVLNASGSIGSTNNCAGYPGVTADGNNGIQVLQNVTANTIQTASSGGGAGAIYIGSGNAQPTSTSNIVIYGPQSLTNPYGIVLPSYDASGLLYSNDSNGVDTMKYATGTTNNYTYWATTSTLAATSSIRQTANGALISPLVVTPTSTTLTSNSSGVVGGFAGLTCPGGSALVSLSSNLTSSTCTAFASGIAGLGTTTQNTYWTGTSTLGSDQFSSVNPTGNVNYQNSESPSQSTSGSVQLYDANPIQGGNPSGTYIGANPTSSNADFINFENNSSSQFKVASSGAISVRGNTGITASCPNGGYLVSESSTGGINTQGTCVTVLKGYAPFGTGNTDALGLAFPGSNKINAYAFSAPSPFLLGYLTFYMQTGDVSTTDLYDVGIANSGGTIICDTGATSTYTTGSGSKNAPCQQGYFTEPAGNYFFAMTGQSTTAKIGYNANNGLTWASSASLIAGSSSGALINFSVPATSTASAAVVIPLVMLHG